jgi:hypothetical protein
VDLVETKNWRATTAMVKELQDNIKLALGDCSGEEAIVVLGVLDNSFYKARSEDGEINNITRGEDGRYHVDGHVVCVPADTSRIAFLQLIPLLKALPEYDKVVLAPLPRYLWRSCCLNARHAPNVADDDHVELQLADIEAANRMWRGLCFRDRIRNIKLCNAGHLLADPLMWNEDPVHPDTAGYKKVVDYLLKGLASMEERRLSNIRADLEVEQNKRPRQEEAPTEPDLRRPAWTRADDNYVSRDTRWISYPENRGRGGYRGRGYGGWPRRAGGWWPQ